MKWILRILAILAGLLLVGVLVLFGMGMRTDADRMQVTVIIHRSPDQVWPWLYEPDKLKTWVTWLKDVRRDAGPLTAGEHDIWTMEDKNNGGMLMNIFATAEAVEPNRSLTLKLSTPGTFHGTAHFVLTDLGGNTTKLEKDDRYQFENWLARLMTPMIMPQARSKAVADLDRLRVAIESK